MGVQAAGRLSATRSAAEPVFAVESMVCIACLNSAVSVVRACFFQLPGYVAYTKRDTCAGRTACAASASPLSLGLREVDA